MSRSLVIKKSVFQRMSNSIKNTVNTIRSEGFPKVIYDMSLPGFGMGVVSPLSADIPIPMDFMMCADSPVPLSGLEFTSRNITGHAPEDLLPAKSHIDKVKSVTPLHEPITQHAALKSGELLIPMETRHLEAPTDKKQREVESDHDKVAQSIIAILEENSLETPTPETVSSKITRIPIDDLLGKKIRIPEYVMVRR